MRHRTPCLCLTQNALLGAINRPRHASSSGGNSFALQTVYNILKKRCPHIYDVRAVRLLLCHVLLSERLFSDAIDVLQGMPASWITPGLWEAVMEAAAEGKIPHSELLSKFLALTPQKVSDEGRVVMTGQRLPAQLRGEVAAKAGRSEITGVKPTNRRHNVNDSIKQAKVFCGDDAAVFSFFEVRSESIMCLTEDGERISEWCRLSAAEMGYAEQHYRGLRNVQGWGYGTLHGRGGDSLKEGVVYGLDARLASRLMLRANVSFFGQASPLIALHILKRHIRTCSVLRELSVPLPTTRDSAVVTDVISSAVERPRDVEEGDDLMPSGSSSLTSEPMSSEALSSMQGSRDECRVHPSPFFLFFKIICETRDVLPVGSEGRPVGGRPVAAPAAGLPMIHWELVWRQFQTLNRGCPNWYSIIPEEAADLCQYVIDVLCRGADPWMTLNVARAVSSRHIVDGLDMSLWLMHRLDPSHHTEEANEVTRKVFRWLLNDVGVHLLPQLHHNLIPAVRVLVRLGLQSELRQLYNGILDNVYLFAEDFRAEFMQVMVDLVCPSCSSILSEQDVFVERVCSICLTVVPAKEVGTLPSFQLSSDHIVRLRERKKQVLIKKRRKLHQSIYEWSKNNDGSTTTGPGGNSSMLPRPPIDASSVFKEEVLTDAVPFIPGVSMSKRTAFFPLHGGGASVVINGDEKEGDSTTFDVYAAMEESSRRLQLQESARRYALAQRGVVIPSRHSAAAPPSLLSASSSPTSPYSELQQHAQQSLSLPSTCVAGPWTCVWCREENSEWGSRLECVACGAEMGPTAPWRHFAYATESRDVMEEIRARVANAGERSVDAVVAAYLLMVYRRAFLLRATPHDAERVDQLIQRLCQLHERVLAGCIYMRFVPTRLRSKNNTLLALSQLFGCSDAAYAGLTVQQLKRDDDTFFQTIFTSATCKVCFGQHEWKMCPIVTRDFSTTRRTSISMTPEEKQETVLRHLSLAVEAAIKGGMKDGSLVVNAYTAFVKSPYREFFAEVHSRDVNQLSLLLSRYHQFRRAAFVLCHIPLYLRDDKAYMALVHYFNVPADDARELLGKRSPLGVADGTHPNFVQVALTCCMCLDERHASFECPRLFKWMDGVKQLQQLSGSASTSVGAVADCFGAETQAKRLRVQVDGWTSAGPERLHAFYRFLLQHIDQFQKDPYEVEDNDISEDDLSPRTRCQVGSLFGSSQQGKMDMNEPVIYAINKTNEKLAKANQKKGAFRMYARTPLSFVSRTTTSAMLRMCGYSEEGIHTLLSGSVEGSGNGDGVGGALSSPGDSTALGFSSEAARAAAVPMQECCLLCFDSGHVYFDCPELAAQPTVAAKLEYVVTHVGGIRSRVDGIRAAAAYVYHSYNFGQLTSEMLRANPSLVRVLLRLTRWCFARGLVGAGTRVLRRLPVEMVPPLAPYTDLWRAAGLAEEVIASRRAQLIALFAAEGLAPRIDVPPTRQTYSNRFISGLSHVLHDELCRHCYREGHALATCSVFHAEVSFGRDYVAAYRMSMMSEQLDNDWRDAYLLKLVDFFFAHRHFMPYHIVGVANALNAIAAMWSFRGEPGIAIKHLLNIPPAYRRRQAFAHVLHALRIPTADVKRVLANFYFSPDGTVASNGKSVDNLMTSATNGGGAVAQHLLMPKPAFRDVAMSAVFSQFPEALAALDESEEHMEIIRRRNATQKIMKEFQAGDMKRKSDVANAVPGTVKQRTSSPLLVVQSGDIASLRDDFDPILTELEMAVGMKLGSRHVLFTESIDVIASAIAPKPEEKKSERTQEVTIQPITVAESSASKSPLFDPQKSSKNGPPPLSLERKDSGPYTAPREDSEIVTVFNSNGGRSGKDGRRISSDNSRTSRVAGGGHKRASSSSRWRWQHHRQQNRES
uniref:Uncharacterized protein n=1 Tax=Trypanosoma congolense (strain IL3000) TaxID=1068625 RepID=G0UQG6_TRYCI|nr:conserved hypothetical protein [Trypanosoma congolense IL3000]